MLDRSGLVGHIATIRPVVEEHLIERLAACLPHLSREELLVRHAATLAAVAAFSTHGLNLVLDDGPPAHLADLVAAWVVGGLRAPAAP